MENFGLSGSELRDLRVTNPVTILACRAADDFAPLLDFMSSVSPTTRSLIRLNVGTAMLADAEVKWQTIVHKADHVGRQGRSVLVGTKSIAASERVADLLPTSNLNPVMLNARQDDNSPLVRGR